MDGTVRQYRVFVPEAPDGPMPLLIAAHGGGGADFAFPQQAEFESLAQAEGFALAFPLGLVVGDNEAEWQLNTTDERRHDIDFMEALLDELAGQHDLDPDRTYATGYSLGSMFTYELACWMADRVSAVASFAGSMPVAPDACDPTMPVSVMHLHATDDSIIPYSDAWDWKAWDEVGTMHDIPGLVDDWAARVACTTEDETAADGSTHVVHGGCTGGARVEHHRLDSGGHAWPDQVGGTATPELLWSFLSEFERP